MNGFAGPPLVAETMKRGNIDSENEQIISNNISEFQVFIISFLFNLLNIYL